MQSSAVENGIKGLQSFLWRRTDFSGALYGFSFTGFEVLTRCGLSENTPVEISLAILVLTSQLVISRKKMAQSRRK
ncbi:hypothetical protein Hanom_Chr17g01528421 [Helianthus anomalus]